MFATIADVSFKHSPTRTFLWSLADNHPVVWGELQEVESRVPLDLRYPTRYACRRQKHRQHHENKAHKATISSLGHGCVATVLLYCCLLSRSQQQRGRD